MERNRNISYPGSAYRPAMTFVPQMHRLRLATNPNATEVYWWRAVHDSTYDGFHGSIALGQPAREGEWVRTLQSGSYTAIIEGESLLARYFQPGSWEQGSIAVLHDPSEFPLAEFDWIMQKGQGGLTDQQIADGAIDARTYTQKEVQRRGSLDLTGAGSVAVTGAAVVGTGTSFTTFFRQGDVFRLKTGATGVVAAIADNTHLTLAAPLPSNVVAMSYSKGVDRLLYPPAALITLVRDNATTYVRGTDYQLSSNGEEIEWLGSGSAPAPGERYAVIYEYYTKYVVVSLGEKGAVVAGSPLLTVVQARLWKPEQLRI